MEVVGEIAAETWELLKATYRAFPQSHLLNVKYTFRINRKINQIAMRHIAFKPRFFILFFIFLFNQEDECTVKVWSAIIIGYILVWRYKMTDWKCFSAKG